LASLAANIEGKRTALSHFIFKLVGLMISLIFLFPFTRLLEDLTPRVAQQIALGHLFFNVLIALIFLPFLRPYSKFLERLLPGTVEMVPLWPVYLDNRLLAQPELALNGAKKEIRRLLTLAQKMFVKASHIFVDFTTRERKDVFYLEPVVDSLRFAILHYLYRLSEDNLTNSSAKALLDCASMADDIERIADHATNLAEIAEMKHKRGIAFTEAGQEELTAIKTLVGQNLEDVLSLLDRKDEKVIRNILFREERIDDLVRQSRERHLVRFYRRLCSAEAGPLFLETLINLERISDHCENIAQYFQELDEF
jgi:phosphate:Na+ symporter